MKYSTSFIWHSHFQTGFPFSSYPFENTYSGREAVVNSVLASLQLASDKGVKLQYTNIGANTGNIPYNTDEQMVDGMDCCAYVSWALNKGTAQPFHWEGVAGLADMGEEISYSEAQPGDIFVIDETDGKLEWRCPNCNNKDQSKMNVARRTCGYIGSQFWNQGRTQEIKDRVLHL